MSVVHDTKSGNMSVKLNHMNRALVPGAIFLALHTEGVRSLEFVAETNVPMPRQLVRFVQQNNKVDVQKKRTQLTRLMQQRQQEWQRIIPQHQHILDAVEMAAAKQRRSRIPFGKVRLGSVQRNVFRHRQVAHDRTMTDFRQLQNMLQQMDPFHRFFQHTMLSYDPQKNTMDIAMVGRNQLLHDTLRKITSVHQTPKLRQIVFSFGHVLEAVLLLDLLGIICDIHIVYNPSSKYKLKVLATNGNGLFMEKIRDILGRQLVPLLERFSSPEFQQLSDEIKTILTGSTTIPELYQAWTSRIDRLHLF